MGRRTSKLATMFVTSALIAGCTHYSAIPLNMVELRDEGREGFTISTEEAEGTDFGRVRGNGRTWLFGDCRPAVSPVALYAGTKHTTSTDLVRQGVDPMTLQRFLGHADRRSTDAYVVLGSGDVKDAVRSRKAPEKPQSK